MRHNTIEEFSHLNLQGIIMTIKKIGTNLRNSITSIFFITLWILLIITVSSHSHVYADGDFELHLLDVGQGQCVLIHSGECNMIIDGGGRLTSSFVVSYLKQQKIESLDYIVVSHYDEDHFAGLIGVLSVFPTKVLMVPSYAGAGNLYRSFSTTALSNEYSGLKRPGCRGSSTIVPQQ